MAPPMPWPQVRVALLVLLALAPLAAASGDTWVELTPWIEGRDLAPTTPFVTTPLATRVPFDAPQCQRHLLLDLLYDPDETGLDVDGVGEAALLHEFRIEVWSEEARLLERKVTRSGMGHALGLLPAEGAYELRLSLAVGADVAWEARLRGRAVFDEPACGEGPLG